MKEMTTQEFNESLKGDKALQELIKRSTILDFYKDIERGCEKEGRMLRMLYDFFSFNKEATITDNAGKTSSISKTVLECLGETYCKTLAEAYKEALEECEKRIA